MIEWKINQLLFGDDIALVVDSEGKLCQLMEEFGQVCRRRNLRVIGNKSKVCNEMHKGVLVVKNECCIEC